MMTGVEKQLFWRKKSFLYLSVRATFDKKKRDRIGFWILDFGFWIFVLDINVIILQFRVYFSSKN
jgi:hypothetical protein